MAENKSDDNTSAYAQIVFVRHGQSTWNAKNLFSGWVDCDLSDLGVKEAKDGAKELVKAKFEFDCMFTSYQKRAIKTGNIILEELDQLWIPVYKSWKLNERMYGNLQGLNKVETVDKFGKDQVLKWRRSFDIPPPKIDANNKYNPRNEAKYKKLKASEIPESECLKDVIARASPFFENEITNEMKKGSTILITAHGNSIRAMLKYLDKISDNIIPSLEIPTGIPLVYKFDKNLKIIKAPDAVEPLSGKFLGDPDKIKKAQQKVKNQIAKKQT
mmetsp:Transcript_73444/g.90150  ORF Transcript_73444/g.90150 Transcript_73444/m.90150 type:complete len:272 (-) Transcript_73444:136-951(-)